MAATQAYAAYGDQLLMGNGATPTEVFTVIAEVRDFNLPEDRLDLWEATNHDSPNGREEHIPTILRTGEVTFDINLIPHATHMNGANSLRQLAVTRTKRNFRVITNDSESTQWDFAAYVTRFGPNSQVTSGGMAAITLKPTGDVVTTQD
jgi:hypothetical protein